MVKYCDWWQVQCVGREEQDPCLAPQGPCVIITGWARDSLQHLRRGSSEPCSPPALQLLPALRGAHTALLPSHHESENGLGWRRSTSSIPAAPPALPPQSTSPGSTCTCWTLQGCWFHLSPWQPESNEPQNLYTHIPGLLHPPWMPPSPQKMPELCGAAGWGIQSQPLTYAGSTAGPHDVTPGLACWLTAGSLPF